MHTRVAHSVHMQLEVIGCCIMLHIFEHTFSAKVWQFVYYFFFVLSLVDLKAQPEPSPILGRLTQNQNAALQSDLPAQARDPAPLPPHDGPSPTLKPHCEAVVTTPEPPQPRNIRPQRRRAPPPSKVSRLCTFFSFCLCVSSVVKFISNVIWQP